jgi:hypothetical protein
MANLDDKNKKDTDADSYGGQYECNTEDAKAKTLKPSKDTKSPFGALSGGK